jgi:polar amino acid transport system substrate-binding protein
VVRTPDREALFDWIGPVSRVEYQVFRLRAGSAATMRSLGQLGRQSIGVLNKDAGDRYLQTVIDPRQIQPVPEYHSLIQMFLAGRFDYLAVVPQGLYEELARLRLPQETVESLFALDYTADPYSYVVVAKGSSPTLVSSLSKALASMKKDGTWERLYRGDR